MAYFPEDDDFVMQWPPPHWAPLGVTAPEMAPPIAGSLPPGQLPPPPAPPPPPPPPPQKVGPDVAQQAEEVAAPIDPPPYAPVVDEAAVQYPPAQEAPLPPVGSAAPVTAYGQPIEEPTPIEPVAPMAADENIFGIDLDGESAPVGSQRTTAREGEQGLSTEEIAALDPMQRAAYFFDEQNKREQMANERMAEIQKTDGARQARAEQDFMDAQAESKRMTQAAIADADALAQEKPKKFADSLGNVLSGLAGIFISSMAGKGEQAVAIVQQRMDRFAQEQNDEYNRKAGNVDRRLNLAARLRDAGYSEFQAANVIRMAGLQRMRDELLTDLQQYDPKGSAAMQRYNALQQTAAAMQKAQQDAEKENLTRAQQLLSLQKTGLEVEEKQRKLQGVGGGKPVEQPLPVEYFKATYPNAPVPPRPMTEKEYGSWIRTTSAGAEASQKLGAETPEQQRVRELGISTPAGQLVNKDGQPFLARDKTIAEKLTKQVTAAGEVVDIIDEILAIRDQHGGEAKVLNSAASQRLRVLENKLVTLAKSGTEGMSSDEDMKKLSGALGATDVDSFRAKAAGLKEGRERTMTLLNRTLRDNQYTGPTVKFQSTADLPKAKASVVDEVGARISRADYGAETTASMVRNATAPAMGTTKRDQEDFTILESYALQANNSNERIAAEGKEAVEMLKQLAGGRAPSPIAKKKAQEILDKLPGSKPPRPH